MIAVGMNKISRDQAKEQARARLPEILSEAIPGFRSERPFRCLNPNHEDRHPSARYLPRANVVKCFSCGWTGDVFDVVGAVYGLAKPEAFKRTFELLGIESRGMTTPRRPVKPPAPRLTPGSRQELLGLIYPPDWDTPEPEAFMVLEDILNQAELAIGGWFDMPFVDDTAMGELVADMFQRFHNGNDVLAIVKRFERRPGKEAGK